MKFQHYWISPSLCSIESDITRIMLTLCRDLKQTSNESTPFTIHIAPTNTVIAKYNSKDFYITDNCLYDIEKKLLTLDNIEMFQSNQLISLCLLNFSVSSTGFSSNTIDQIVQKVHLLGGTYEHTLNKKVGILIASKSVSQKIYSATSENIPIVRIDWIDSCFRSLFLMPPDSFSLSPFFNIKFTTTDLPSKESRALAKIIQKLGGEFSEKFDQTTTFLIANTISTTKKFELALMYNIPIVTTEWIKLCIRREKIVDPTPFIMNSWCISDQFSQLFHDITFGISKDIKNKDILIDIILANKGSYSEKPNYYITKTRTNVKNVIQVTPRWLLMCCHEKRILDPSTSFTFSPFSFPLKIQGVFGQSFQLANIREEKRVEYAEILRSLNASVFYSFSKTVNMIIADNPSTRLLMTADNYSIPIVKVSWLSELCQTGILPNINNHLHIQKLSNNVNLHSICQRINESIRANQIKTSMMNHQDLDTELNYSQLSKCTQHSYHENPCRNDITYGSSQENYEINLNAGVDPLLAALSDL